MGERPREGRAQPPRVCRRESGNEVESGSEREPSLQREGTRSSRGGISMRNDRVELPRACFRTPGMRLALATVAVTLVAFMAPATHAAAAPSHPAENYCNVLDLTPACAAELEAGLERLAAAPVEDQSDREAASCSVPEASMRNLGGTLPGHKRVQGYGYVLCNAPVNSLAIHGSMVIDVAGSSGEVPVIGTIIVGYGNSSTGGWSCVMTFLCMMSTQIADGYGIEVCSTLTNIGTTSEGYVGSKQGYDCF